MRERDWCRLCGASGPHASVVTPETAEDSDDIGYPICDDCVATHERNTNA